MNIKDANLLFVPMTFGFQKVKDVTMTPIKIKCCHALGHVGTMLQIWGGGNTNEDGNEYLLVKRHNLSTAMETLLREI